MMRYIFVVFTSFSAACSDASSVEAEGNSRRGALSGNVYIDARTYLSEPTDIDAWYALMSTLKTNFDDVCGDTFCEGDFSNYESLGFRCSVVEDVGTVGVCVWIFAASNDEVVPSSGNVRVRGETWRCRMPVLAGTPIKELMQRLSVANQTPIFAPLPHTQKTLYDGLTECL